MSGFISALYQGKVKPFETVSLKGSNNKQLEVSLAHTIKKLLAMCTEDQKNVLSELLHISYKYHDAMFAEYYRIGMKHAMLIHDECLHDIRFSCYNPENE